MDDKIKVTDKRMFDASGELREEYRDGAEVSEEASPTAEPATESRKPAPPLSEPEATAAPDLDPGGAGRPPTGNLPKPGMMDLIGLVAQPIPMFLGDARPPDGESAENLEVARYHIDLLELIQDKTKGRLDVQEEKLLAELLYQFRMRYVEKAG
ncbi:MAG: DUF1844 domain-containing protein [Thermoanaerobaculia bacterium]